MALDNLKVKKQKLVDISNSIKNIDKRMYITKCRLKCNICSSMIFCQSTLQAYWVLEIVWELQIVYTIYNYHINNIYNNFWN